MSSFWDAAALLFLWYRDDDVKHFLQGLLWVSEIWGLALVGTISLGGQNLCKIPLSRGTRGEYWPKGHREGVEGGNRHQAFLFWVTKPGTIMRGPF